MTALLSWIQHPAGIVLFVVHLGVAARAITRPGREPASRVAWVAVVMAVPLLGVVGYALLGETSIGRRRVARLRAAEQAAPAPTAPSPADLPAADLFTLAGQVNGFAATAGNRIELLGDPGATAHEPQRDSVAAVEAMVAEIGAATDTVHLAFYIWLDDTHGGRVVDAVCAAAARGVTCRVMVDALGSRAFIRSPRWRQLAAAGVRTEAVLDDVPRLGHLALGRVDLRNHRKIAVIDNRTAFCGSQNCADPEFRVAARYAPWVDVWFRCQGPVVRQEQWLFAVTWAAATGEDLSALASAEPAPASAGAVSALMFGTGPTTGSPAMSEVFVATIYAARRELVVTTPYFVPDEALLRALCGAPRRGARTTLVLPARNNSRLVAASSRSTYAALVASGVAVHEYPLGLLHSKTITVDGELCLVGSANMDRRSLELNFENNLVAADPDLVAAVRARQESYLSVSRRVEADAVRGWGLPTRLWQNTVAMLGPVLRRSAVGSLG